MGNAYFSGPVLINVRPLVNHDGEMIPLAERVHSHHPRIGGMDVLVDWPELHAAQFQAHDLLKRLSIGSVAGSIAPKPITFSGCSLAYLLM